MTADYKLIGPPRKQRSRGKASANYVQRYRLLDDPPRKIRAVSLQTSDLATARGRADRFVRSKLSEASEKANPQHATKQPKLHALVDEYTAYLRLANNSDDHCTRTGRRAKLIFDRAGCKSYSDITPAAIVSAIGSYVRANKRSAITAERYRESCKSFTRWMYADANKWDSDPLATMAEIKGDDTPRRRRGSLTAGEFDKLVKSTRTQSAHHGLTGILRVWLYILATNTGARAKELSSLTKASFDLFARTVTIHCTISKRRKTDVIPLSKALVLLLRPWLAEQPDTGRLFPGAWFRKAAPMLKADLEAAGIKYEIDTPKGCAMRDFHSLRRVRVTALILSGAPKKVIREVARLSSESLLDRYADVSDEVVQQAVESIPLFAG